MSDCIIETRGLIKRYGDQVRRANAVSETARTVA